MTNKTEDRLRFSYEAKEKKHQEAMSDSVFYRMLHCDSPSVFVIVLASGQTMKVRHAQVSVDGGQTIMAHFAEGENVHDITADFDVEIMRSAIVAAYEVRV